MRSSLRLVLCLAFLGALLLRGVLVGAQVPTPRQATPTPPTSPTRRPVPTPSLPWASPSTVPVGPAQDTVILGGEQLTLDECLAYARDHHPTLKAAQARYAQGMARVRQSQALYVPSVGISITRSHTYTQNGGVAPGSPAATFGAIPNVVNVLLQPTATFNYMLYDGGKRRLSVRRDVADLLTYVLDWRAQWRKLALQIEEDYLSLVYNRALLVVQQDSVHMASETLQQAEGLFRAGKKTRLDVLQAETDLLGARTQFYLQMGVLNRAWASLESDLGAPLNQFARLDPLMDETLPVPSRERVLEMAFTQRSDVQSYANQIAVRRIQMELNKTALRPTLQSILSYGYTGQDFPLLNTFNAQMAVAFPLTSRAGVVAQNEEVLGAIQELLGNTYTLRLQIIGSVSRAYISMAEAAQRVEIARQQVRKAEQSYEIAFRRYKGGISEFIEVTNARNVLNSARTTLQGARNDRKRAEIQLFAEIEEALPRPSPPAGVPVLPAEPGAPVPPAGTPQPAAPGPPGGTPQPAAPGDARVPAPPPTPVGASEE